MPNRGPRKILDVNKPVKERKKPGPKPKPKPDPLLVDPATYVPPPRKKPKIRYTNEQIIEVLQFLYYHRILDKIPDGTVGEKLPRYRSGTILQKRPDLAKAPEGRRYRSPTYEEAADWFQIPKSTVSTWWNTKLEMIGIKPEQVPQAPMPDFLLTRPNRPAAAPGPVPAQQPQPQPQLPRPASGGPAVNGNPVVGSYSGVPVVTSGGRRAQNPASVLNPPQGARTTLLGVVGPAQAQLPPPMPQQSDVAAQATAPSELADSMDPPAPSPAEQKASAAV